MRGSNDQTISGLENTDFIGLPAASIFEKISEVDLHLHEKIFQYAEEMQRARFEFAQRLNENPPKKKYLKAAFLKAVTAFSVMYFILKNEISPSTLKKDFLADTPKTSPHAAKLAASLNDRFIFDEKTFPDDLRRAIKRVMQESLIPEDRLNEGERLSLQIYP
jgi:hypothetical protein